jgi:hypothetical protein
MIANTILAALVIAAIASEVAVVYIYRRDWEG